MIWFLLDWQLSIKHQLSNIRLLSVSIQMYIHPCQAQRLGLIWVSSGEDRCIVGSFTCPSQGHMNTLSHTENVLSHQLPPRLGPFTSSQQGKKKTNKKTEPGRKVWLRGNQRSRTLPQQCSDFFLTCLDIWGRKSNRMVCVTTQHQDTVGVGAVLQWWCQHFLFPVERRGI